MTEAFFNRPARPIDLSQLIFDIGSALDRIYLVSAWLTNDEIAQAVADVPINEKCVILNAADLARPGAHRAAQILLDEQERIQKQDGTSVRAYERGFVHVLGSGDWKEGVMHCKFIVADNVVWVGSYNFTFQAAKNYEVLLRIEDSELADEFVTESKAMVEDAPLWQGYTQSANGSGAFRCSRCERIYPNIDAEGEIGTLTTCIHCVPRGLNI